jgi:hypothetical protein
MIAALEEENDRLKTELKTMLKKWAYGRRQRPIAGSGTDRSQQPAPENFSFRKSSKIQKW